MTTGLIETAKRMAEENPDAMQEEPNGLASKVGQMLDMDDPSLRTLDSFLNTTIFFGVVGGGLDMLANAGDVMSIGNASLAEGLNDGLDANFGNSPNITAQFGPDGSPVAAPAGPAVGTTPGINNTAGAAPSTMPGFKPGGMS